MIAGHDEYTRNTTLVYATSLHASLLCCRTSVLELLAAYQGMAGALIWGRWSVKTTGCPQGERLDGQDEFVLLPTCGEVGMAKLLQVGISQAVSYT
jgi:hypothetical protein